MNRRQFIQKAGFTGMILFLDPAGPFSNSPEDIEKNFVNPPPSAHPYAYWFWMNGNISREGITLDLEAMKEIGIGGVFNFDAGVGIPKGPVEYFSEEWLTLKKHAIDEAERLGLEFTMHNCPGFSASGGPWISPEMAMQQITWSETYIQGGKNTNIHLPRPNNRLNFYKDIGILAFPSLKEEKLMQTVKVTTNDGLTNLQQLNGNGAGIATHPRNNGPAWIQFEFQNVFEASLIIFYIAGIPSENLTEKKPETGERTSVILEASDDGKIFRTVTPINTGVESELMAGDKYIVYDIPVTRYMEIGRASCRERV